MTVQVFLTVWLMFQMLFEVKKAVEYSRLKGFDENKVIAFAIGTALKFVGIFICLYFGDFYS